MFGAKTLQVNDPCAMIFRVAVCGCPEITAHAEFAGYIFPAHVVGCWYQTYSEIVITCDKRKLSNMWSWHFFAKCFEKFVLKKNFKKNVNQKIFNHHTLSHRPSYIAQKIQSQFLHLNHFHGTHHVTDSSSTIWNLTCHTCMWPYYFSAPHWETGPYPFLIY